MNRLNANFPVRSQAGVSLVELMMAMTVFSFMLLIIVKGVLGVVKVQQSGIVSRNTQQNARSAMEQIVREARTATDAHVNGSAPLQTLCLVTAGGLVEYFVNTTDHRLHRATIDYNSGFLTASNNCQYSPLPTFGSNAALTSSDVAVVRFEAVVASLNPIQLTVKKLSVSTSPSVTTCPAGAGSQFCSVTDLSSTVSLRGTP